MEEPQPACSFVIPVRRFLSPPRRAIRVVRQRSPQSHFRHLQTHSRRLLVALSLIVRELLIRSASSPAVPGRGPTRAGLRVGHTLLSQSKLEQRRLVRLPEPGAPALRAPAGSTAYAILVRRAKLLGTRSR